MKKDIIKPYNLSNGDKRFKFQVYLGINPLTGKEARTTRRGFKTKKEATLELARVRLEFETQGQIVKKKSMTFKEAADLWLAVYKQTNVKRNTFDQNEVKFDIHILPKFGHLLLDKITPDYCQKVVLEWADYYQQFSTLISLTSRVFDYARLTLKQISENPIKDIIRPAGKDKEPYKSPYYDRHQLSHFLSCADQMDYQTSMFFRLAAYSGCRKGELIGLRWADYDEVSNSIRIERTVAKTKASKKILHPPKTKSGKRTISLDAETGIRLREWKRIQRIEMLKFGYSTGHHDQHIFTNKKNKLMDLSYPNFLLSQIGEKYEPCMK